MAYKIAVCNDSNADSSMWRSWLTSGRRTGVTMAKRVCQSNEALLTDETGKYYRLCNAQAQYYTN